MKGCLVALGILVGLVTAVLGLLWLNLRDIHVRYRLTVEVQDGDLIRDGSSVFDVPYHVDFFADGPHTYHVSPVGYAPTVDLGEKGLLFLTMDEWRPREQESEARKGLHTPCTFGLLGCLPFVAYNISGVWQYPDYPEQKARLYELLRQSGPRDVPFGSLPRLSRFLDINDPLSLVPVSPYDLASKFGPGVKLKHVILELTDDPVMPQPKTWPQWLAKKGDTYDYDHILFHIPER